MIWHLCPRWPVTRDLEFLRVLNGSYPQPPVVLLVIPTFLVGHLILRYSLALFVSKLQYPVCHPLAS